MKYYVIYFIVISFVTAFITIYDKRISKHPDKRRVSEKTLFLLAFLGGSIAEYLTMIKIRHKTKHKRFMIGLPVIIFLQLCLIGYIIFQL